MTNVANYDFAMLEREPPDQLTFGAVCAALESCRRERSEEYDRRVGQAQRIVSRIPPGQCRLLHWPVDVEGQRLAATAGFWPALRSLGFASYFEYYDPPTGRAFLSAIERSLPRVLGELSVDVDDARSVTAVFSGAQLARLSIYPGEADLPALLQALPSSVSELEFLTSLSEESSATILSHFTERGADSVGIFNASCFRLSVFREWISKPPGSLKQLGAQFFLSDSEEKLDLLTDDCLFSLRMRKLFLMAPWIGDRLAARLGAAAFPMLESLDIPLARPFEGARHVISAAGAESLAKASWWRQLQELRLAGAHSDEVLSKLLCSLSSSLQILVLEHVSWNPAAGAGFTDSALIDLADEAVASLDVLRIHHSKVDGAFLGTWLPTWELTETGLRELDISFSLLRDSAAIRAFFGSPAIGRLESLTLDWPDSPRIDDVAVLLCSAHRWPSLHTLSLRGWPVGAKGLKAMTDAPGFAETLRTLAIDLDGRNDDRADFEEALARWLDSPLLAGLRSLSIRLRGPAEALCRLLESRSDDLPHLRCLSIEANEFRLEWIGPLARAKCLQSLWKLALKGTTPVHPPTTDAKAALDAIRRLGESETLRSLYSLDIDDVIGFDESAASALSQLALVADLMEIPDPASLSRVWSRSDRLSPFMRGVVESYARRKND